MKYNMQEITEMIPKLFVMLKSTEGRNQEKYQVLMVKPLVSSKGTKGRKRNFKKKGKQVAAQVKKTQVWT